MYFWKFSFWNLSEFCASFILYVRLILKIELKLESFYSPCNLKVKKKVIQCFERPICQLQNTID